MIPGSLNTAIIENFSESIIDDFERTALSFYSGDTGFFSTATDQFFSGARALKHDTTTSNVYTIGSTSGLDNYFEVGTVCELRLRISSLSNISNLNFSFAFAVSTAANIRDNCFLVRVSPTNGVFDILKFVAGSPTFLASTALTAGEVPTDEWCRVVVSWSTNGDINCEFRDGSNSLIKSVSTNDTALQANSGIGFLVNSINITDRRAFWVDDVKIIGAA